jgi:hypothetical protein
MSDSEKLSEIYNETITAVKNYNPNMSLEEKEKFYNIIKKNKRSLGLHVNPRVMTYDEIKIIPSLIDRNIRMSMKCDDLSFLKELKRLLEEDPDFKESFNF